MICCPGRVQISLFAGEHFFSTNETMTKDTLFQLQTKTLKGLPDVLVFNCHLENTRDYDFWRMQEEVGPRRSFRS